MAPPFSFYFLGGNDMDFKKKTYKVYYNYCVGGFSKARDERYQFDKTMPIPTFDNNGRFLKIGLLS